ncbi:hypothetical protein BSL78_09805 [Apostichopus japonicus]|uniref:Death domain-containing protein n=1 Tax=Stichopus japonicus TaxID=307972 RepID=A0A2G8KZ81_STIJA|nr:hypothetical protein BSL78_09805 [Apostichopus japonicus]
MMIHLSNDITKESALKIAKAYGLPASIEDGIYNDRSPGLGLMTALEQRLKVSHELDILNEFCQTLYDLDLNKLADRIKNTYPQLTARPPAPQVTTNTDVSDATLSELSGYIGAEWKQIALGGLKLKRYELDQIEEDNNRSKDKIYASFALWRKKNHGKASPKELLALLQKQEDLDQDAIEILEKEVNRGERR